MLLMKRAQTWRKKTTNLATDLIKKILGIKLLKKKKKGDFKLNTFKVHKVTLYSLYFMEKFDYFTLSTHSADNSSERSPKEERVVLPV